MDWTYAAIFPTLLIAGVAFALAYGPLTIAATDGVTESEQGLASGLLHTATQFGSAIGISAVTAVYGLASSAAGTGAVPGSPGSASDPEATLSAFRAALIVPVVMVTLGALLSSFGLRGRRKQASGTSAEVATKAANPGPQTVS
jgi:hypothetical protein